MAHTVRQATIRDLEQLVPLFDGYRQFYGRVSDLRAAREFLLARFNNDESTVFIAHEDERAIGFTQLYPSFSSISLARIFILRAGAQKRSGLFFDVCCREVCNCFGCGSPLTVNGHHKRRCSGAVPLSWLEA